jgi:hypothetical protein
MNNVTDVNFIRDLFVNWYETDEGGDYLNELPYEADKGTDIPVADKPEGWTLTVVDKHTELERDSYGYGSLEDGYIIFEVSDGTRLALYKLPLTYASFEGWDIATRHIKPTVQRAKTIQIWEES